MIGDLTAGLTDYIIRKSFAGIRAAEGHLLDSIVTYEELRMTRSAPRIRTGLCLRDDLCYLSCRDAGGDAITVGPDRYPVVNIDKCLGCSLCMQVCPSEGCITMEEVGADREEPEDEERKRYGSGD
jgi:dihydropyrimidine dehydrogenase (NAD+) subunit PreA